MKKACYRIYVLEETEKMGILATQTMLLHEVFKHVKNKVFGCTGKQNSLSCALSMASYPIRSVQQSNRSKLTCLHLWCEDVLSTEPFETDLCSCILQGIHDNNLHQMCIRLNSPESNTHHCKLKNASSLAMIPCPAVVIIPIEIML